MAGCGGTGSSVAALDGVYQSSSDDKDTTGCGTGAPTGTLPIFRIESGALLGTNAAKYELCTSTTPSSCLDLGILSIIFTERTSDGWADDTYNGTASGSSCLLTHTTSTLTTTSGTEVQVVFETHSVTATSSSDCTPTAARAAASTMTCTKREVEVAARVN